MTTGSHYTVLARRFRPQAFDDVVGQEHVSRALRNAIRAGRVAHAYMFTGARGVGKTSTARILAKALNCPNAVDGVPCNQCEICDGISAGNDVDVLEIDGASNRGIDDIRSLRANVGVRSMRTQFKVYIIDEVHMLTKEAFNALLKTLEEPPPNVKFIFCTTEPNKVPDTILSRCQRFDFSSINDRSIGDRLREIAKAEGFEVSEDALELVARRARGSMRDSQSLFDQLLAFSDGTVSAEDVHRMLGTAGDDRLLELYDAIIEHRPGEVLTLLDAAFGLGVQPGELMDQCIGFVRDLIVTLSGGTQVSLCSVANRHRESLMLQASRMGMHTIMAAFQILSDAKTQMFRSTFARTVLEMAMVQLSLLENLTALSELLSGRLPALPDIPTTSATGTVTSGSATAQRAVAALPGEKKNIEQLTSRTSASATPSDVLPELDEEEDSHDTDQDNTNQDDLVHDETGSPSIQAGNRTLSTMLAGGQGEIGLPAKVAAAQVSLTGSMDASTKPSGLTSTDLPVQPSAQLSAQPSAKSIPEVTSSITQADCPRLFQELLKSVGLTISAGLKMANDLVLASPNRLEIHLDGSYDFAKKVLDQPDSRARIETEIQKITGEAISISLRLLAPQRPPVTPDREKNAAPAKPVSASSNGNGRPTVSVATPGAPVRAVVPEVAPLQNLLGEVDPNRDPFVKQVMEVFGATVVKVTVAPSVQVVDTEATT